MFSLEDRIINRLLLKADSLSDIGLLDGKMGIAIMFAECGYKNKNRVFRLTFEQLLDQILDNINGRLSFDFAKGLSGIGWGIEYMLQKGYVEGDAMDVCQAIDSKIIQYDPRRIKDLSMETGLEGLLHYVLIHIQGSQLNTLPFDNTYLNDLTVALNQCYTNTTGLSNRFRLLIDNYMEFYHLKKHVNYIFNLRDIAEYEPINEFKISSYPFGINKGLGASVLFNQV